MTTEKRLRIAWPTNQPFWVFHYSKVAVYLLLKYDIEDADVR